MRECKAANQWLMGDTARALLQFPRLLNFIKLPSGERRINAWNSSTGDGGVSVEIARKSSICRQNAAAQTGKHFGTIARRIWKTLLRGVSIVRLNFELALGLF